MAIILTYVTNWFGQITWFPSLYWSRWWSKLLHVGFFSMVIIMMALSSMLRTSVIVPSFLSVWESMIIQATIVIVAPIVMLIPVILALFISIVTRWIITLLTMLTIMFIMILPIIPAILIMINHLSIVILVLSIWLWSIPIFITRSVNLPKASRLRDSIIPSTTFLLWFYLPNRSHNLV